MGVAEYYSRIDFSSSRSNTNVGGFATAVLVKELCLRKLSRSVILVGLSGCVSILTSTACI